MTTARRALRGEAAVALLPVAMSRTYSPVHCLLVEGSAADVRQLQPPDIVNSYQLRANHYLKKPAQLDAFENLVTRINGFWLTKAKLPPRRSE
jgi:hypothetical protein